MQSEAMMPEFRKPDRAGRRRLILAAPALIVGAAMIRPAAALTPTPRQSEGPFYPRSLPADRDADLTVFEGRRAEGEVIEMAGRLLDVRGNPVSGGEIEIWHCDPDGVYAHVGRSARPNFQGYGVVRTGGGGDYRFRTLRPGLYTGRARHIHVRARRPDGPDLTTQMYFPGEPGNAKDFLLARAADPDALIAREAPGPPLRYLFDIVVA